MNDHKKKPRHVRREKPKNEIQFTVKVDQKLFDKANKARTETWVQLTTRMLVEVIKVAEDEASNR